MADPFIPKTQDIFAIPGVTGSAPGTPAPAAPQGNVTQHLKKTYGIELPPTP